MITALSTPASGRILLDANNTEIRIQSTNGDGFYFRAKIYINDVLFDEQGWSRVDAYTAIKDLKKLYQAYFTPAFNTSFLAGLTEQTNLQRKVNITVEEYSLETGEITGTLDLPVFYIVYNIRPELFTDASVVRFLGLDAGVLVLPVNGKIAIPFYSAYSGNITVSLTTNQGTEINSATVANTDKKFYLYKYNLASYSLGTGIPYLLLTITAGLSKITRTIRIMYNTAYPVKEIAFRNNFGYYLYAYPFGQMETESSYEIEGYETADGSQKVYEINEEETYTINSGSYKGQEKTIIGMIAASPDVKLSISTGFFLRANAGWVDLYPKTKKHTSFTDKVHNYSDKLSFSIRKGTDIKNSGFITAAPSTPDIQITASAVTGTSISITYVFNNGFDTANLRLQVKTSPSSTWYVVGDIVSGGSVTFTKPVGSYTARLVDYNNQNNVSNSVAITIS